MNRPLDHFRQGVAMLPKQPVKAVFLPFLLVCSFVFFSSTVVTWLPRCCSILELKTGGESQTGKKRVQCRDTHRSSCLWKLIVITTFNLFLNVFYKLKLRLWTVYRGKRNICMITLAWSHTTSGPEEDQAPETCSKKEGNVATAYSTINWVGQKIMFLRVPLTLFFNVLAILLF